MRTPICDRLGIEYPIFAFTPSEHVAAAVSRAGGLGVLGCVRFNEADELDAVLSWMDENTGGEKVYPEEVESAMKQHPGVYDVLVVGVPDETYGSAVAAVVQPRDGHVIELEEVRTFLRPLLSGYKLPRHLRIVAEMPRTATGKANYPAATEIAMEREHA